MLHFSVFITNLKNGMGSVNQGAIMKVLTDFNRSGEGAHLLVGLGP